jgi:hypothetical protein
MLVMVDGNVFCVFYVHVRDAGWRSLTDACDDVCCVIYLSDAGWRTFIPACDYYVYCVFYFLDAVDHILDFKHKIQFNFLDAGWRRLIIHACDENVAFYFISLTRSGEY